MHGHGKHEQVEISRDYIYYTQKMAGGRPLYKLGKSMGSKTIEEMDLPKQAFAMIPMSDVFDRVTKSFQNYWAR